MAANPARRRVAGAEGDPRRVAGAVIGLCALSRALSPPRQGRPAEAAWRARWQKTIRPPRWGMPSAQPNPRGPAARQLPTSGRRSPTPTCGSGSRRRASSARSAKSGGSPGKTTSAWPPRSILHDENAPCVVFEDIPGTLAGSKVLVNFFGGRRQRMTLGFPLHLSKLELSEAFRAHYMADLKRIPPRYVNDGPVFENVDHRRRGRRHHLPDAEMAPRRRRPLHRHRQLQRHARSRRGLDQLRHLSGDDPRREDRRLLHLARQARPHPARQVRGAQGADAGRDRGRLRPDVVPDGVERGALRRVRIRRDRRHPRRPGRRGEGADHRAAGAGQCGDRDRGLRPAGQRQAGRAVRRVDGILRQRCPRRAGDGHQGDLSSQQSDPARLRAAAPARRDRPLPRADALGDRAREHRQGRRSRRRRRLGARDRHGAPAARRRHQAALSGPRHAGRPRRRHVPLRAPMRAATSSSPTTTSTYPIWRS